MANIELYLKGHHKELQTIILCIGSQFNPHKLQHFLLDVPISNLIITGNLPERKFNSIIKPVQDLIETGKLQTLNSLKYCTLQKLLSSNELRPSTDFAIVFDNLDDNNDILSLSNLRPKCLIGNVWYEDYISAFSIWEHFRSVSSYINITTYRHNKEPQVLEWESNFNSNNVELSVIFPMYNVEQYLPACIESVTKWKASYVEFLFVNDGSPDNSSKVIQQYAQQDSRIKLLNKENGGCASARQYGFEHSSGRYVCFIDPDDFTDESMLRKLLRAALIGTYDISYCGYNEYYESNGDSSEVPDLLGCPYCDGTSDFNAILNLINYQRIGIWRTIFRTEMLHQNKIHFYTELRRFDDLPFWAEATVSAKSVIAVPEHLYYYRLQRPGQDVSADDERLYVHFDIFKFLDESLMSKKNQHLNDALLVRKVATHKYALEKIKPDLMQEYAKQAKCDLKNMGSLFRSSLVLKKRCGMANVKCYFAIMSGNRFLLNHFFKK